MVVFSVFFGKLAKVPSDGVPYPLFAYCGLLPWQLFSYAMTESSNSVVSNQQLITKVYFPRLVIPVSAVISGLVDFSISFSLLLLMMPFYGVMPTVRILVLPLFILFAIATALAIGLWLSALNVEYRDVRYTIPFLTQFWLLLTPVAYPSSLVPAKWRALMGLNPMAGVVEGFRWALLGNSSSGSGALMMVSVVIVIALLFGGIVYFRRMETTFADLV
jgi:lipopolysaccharide transport system permease protein